MSLEELTESTGYDRTSILAALCAITLQKGGAQLPAVQKALIKQGGLGHGVAGSNTSMHTNNWTIVRVEPAKQRASRHRWSG